MSVPPSLDSSGRRHYCKVFVNGATGWSDLAQLLAAGGRVGRRSGVETSGARDCGSSRRRSSVGLDFYSGRTAGRCVSMSILTARISATAARTLIVGGYRRERRRSPAEAKYDFEFEIRQTDRCLRRDSAPPVTRVWRSREAHAGGMCGGTVASGSTRHAGQVVPRWSRTTAMIGTSRTSRRRRLRRRPRRVPPVAESSGVKHAHMRRTGYQSGQHGPLFRVSGPDSARAPIGE